MIHILNHFYCKSMARLLNLVNAHDAEDNKVVKKKNTQIHFTSLNMITWLRVNCFHCRIYSLIRCGLYFQSIATGHLVIYRCV